MYPTGYRRRKRLLDDLKLAGWRQLIRLTRWFARLKAAVEQVESWIVPIREYLWLPAVAGMVGLIVGLVIALM